jgi:cytochrome P450/ferredoxin-NADP reductase
MVQPAIAASPTGCPFQNPRAIFADLAVLRVIPGIPYSEHFEAHIVSRYHDVVEVLERPDIFSSKPTVPETPPFVKKIFAGKVPEGSTLLNWDNPDHDRLRQSVASFFVPRRLERFEAMIQHEAHKLVDNFVTRGHTDLKAEFALPLPLKVIAAVTGLDPARWDWIGRSLALFGGHAAMRTGSLEDQVQGILGLHQYIADLIEERKNDRRDDLISHIWNCRDAKVVEMTDMEHLMMIPGLLLAGHETTTNFLSMSMSHVLANGLWDRISRDDDSRKTALEELLRFESAITGMRRVATVDTTIGGYPIKAGTPLFVAYNSGSRDPSIFAEPDKIDLDRSAKLQHLAFGKGIHACLGAPLARLLLRVEMRVLSERLPGLRLLTPYSEVEYDHVHEGRGVSELRISWKPQQPRVDTKPPVVVDLPSIGAVSDISLRVAEKEMVADNVLQLTLEAEEGKSLPPWQPGAHIDISVGDLGYRQYSLCFDSKEESRWRVGVLLELGGLGGSKYIHRNVSEGDSISVRGPRNHFQLESCVRYLFIAGGIGITPITSMIEAAERSLVQYKVLYLGTSRSSMAFCHKLSRNPSVTIWAKDEKGRFDVGKLAAEDPKGLKIYCCGPKQLITAVQEACAAFPMGTLNVEHFAANDQSELENTPFEVELARSGKILTVPSDQTLLQVLNANGAGILSTCSKGTCGTCEIGVLRGVPEHRDTVLTPVEKLEGKTMMPCVSRCISNSLMLDLW